MPQPPNERSHKVIAAIEIIDKLNYSQEELEDLTGYLAARCGIKLVQWLNPVDFSDLVEHNPAIAEILNPETQIIYSDEKSTITVADCFPCPLTGKPCPTNGAMGTISHYYYPGDCPNSLPCEEEAKSEDPCPCGGTYANNCDGSCPSLNFDLY